MNHIVFDEDTLYYRILVNSSQVLNKIKNDKDKKSEFKKVKKIYNNVFGLLLTNEYNCEKVIKDNIVYYKLDLEDESYLCDEESLKNVLFTNFDEIIAKSLKEV